MQMRCYGDCLSFWAFICPSVHCSLAERSAIQLLTRAAALSQWFKFSKEAYQLPPGGVKGSGWRNKRHQLVKPSTKPSFKCLSGANVWEVKGYVDRDVVLLRAPTQLWHPNSRSCSDGMEGSLSTQRLDGSMPQEFHWDCLVISREQETKKPLFSTLEWKGVSFDRTQTNQTWTVPVPVTAASPRHFLSLWGFII